MASIIPKSVRTFLQFPRIRHPQTWAFLSTAPPNKHSYEEMVKKNKVVVFMKGVPEQPMCGFSNAVVQIFRMHGVQYDSYNVLADETLRQGN